MKTQSQNQETILLTIARVWVLEYGRDCDGVSTRGQVMACGNLLDADVCHTNLDSWSDGNYYKVTEKWSEVVDYCNNYFMDYDDFATVNYITK